MSGKIPPVGSLRDRVQLQRKSMAPNESGGHDVLYVPLTSVWARVHALSGRFDGHAGARGAEITHTVVMRFRNDLQAGDRIIYRGQGLEVISAGDLNGRRAYLNCRCRLNSVAG